MSDSNQSGTQKKELLSPEMAKKLSISVAILSTLVILFSIITIFLYVYGVVDVKMEHSSLDKLLVASLVILAILVLPWEEISIAGNKLKRMKGRVDELEKSVKELPEQVDEQIKIERERRELYERLKCIDNIQKKLEMVKGAFKTLRETGKMPKNVPAIDGETLLLTEIMRDLQLHQSILTEEFHGLLKQKYDLVCHMWNGVNLWEPFVEKWNSLNDKIQEKRNEVERSLFREVKTGEVKTKQVTLDKTQERLLRLVESRKEGLKQEDAETEMKEHVYYPLETLCLLELIEKKEYGTRNSFPSFIYFLKDKGKRTLEELG